MRILEAFESQLDLVRNIVEKYVRFRVNSTDADDLIQDIFLTAYLKYSQLEKKKSFKPWILTIARNRCHDYFRKQQKIQEVPLEEIPEHKLAIGRMGPSIPSPVEETLDLLTQKDREILRLFYWQGLSLVQISETLNLPPGTVKSRLHTAREHFRK